MSEDAIVRRVRAVLDDPRVPASVRTAVAGYLAGAPVDPAAVMDYCARTVAIAVAAARDPHTRAGLAWAMSLGNLAFEPSERAAATSPAPVPSPAAAPSRAPEAAAYFSPGDDCLDAIRRAFDGAKKTAEVCVFTITDDRIRDAMRGAHRRGVKLRVITDNDKAYDEGSDVQSLHESGIEVRVDRTEAHMHHKFAVFDGQRLLNGSYNWTRSAARVNCENVIVTADPALVRSFSREFERLWESLRD